MSKRNPNLHKDDEDVLRALWYQFSMVRIPSGDECSWHYTAPDDKIYSVRIAEVQITSQSEVSDE